jgi:hypothetical protein
MPVVLPNVFCDGIGIFHLLSLFYYLRHCIELLAHQLIHRGHYQYLFSDQVKHEEECIRGCSVCMMSHYPLQSYLYLRRQFNSGRG